METRKEAFQARDALSGANELLGNWAHLNTQIIWAYDAEVTQDKSGIPFRCTPAMAWLLRQGEVTLEFKNSPTEVYTPGVWVFGRCTDGRQTFAPGSQLLSIRYMAEWPTGMPLFDRGETVVVQASAAPSLEVAGVALANFAEQQYPGASTRLLQQHGALSTHLELRRLEANWLVAYADAMHLAGLRPNRMDVADERLRKALQDLQTRSLAEPMRERELAAAAGLSLSQLNRLFAAKVGRTPAELWELRRLRRSMEYLAGSANSIKSIAFELGFSSPGHFTNWFRTKQGVSPSEYRRYSQQQVV